MDNNYSYCRLCAESKPCNKQLDLLSDSEKKSETLLKLNRVNASVFEFEANLPSTVCFNCLNTLNKAYDFVLTIEYANMALSEIFLLEKVKKEEIDCEDQTCNLAEKVKMEFKEESHADEELDSIAASYCEELDSYSDGGTLLGVINTKNAKTLDIDSIPLSQLKSTWFNYRWLCTYCEIQFSCIDELKTHSMQCHNTCNPYRCPDCKIRKSKLDSFLIHIQRHHKHLKYSCYICFKQFNMAREARKHRRTHISTKFNCSGCNTSFANIEELNKHTEAYNKARRGRPIPKQLQSDGLTCNICRKSFKTRSGLNTHVLIHTDRKKDSMCEVCGKGFFAKYDLEAHMVSHKDDRPHKCEICNLAFKTISRLKNHVGVHNNAKPHACVQCGKCFRLRKQLESHSIIHTDIHPFECPLCGKRFRFRTTLNNHMRLHTGVRPYSCESCQRDFTNWSNYNKHMKRKHNMDTSKKKHTPDGVYPIDPKTGEVIICEETNQIIEWKKKMMVNRGLGRPRKKEKEEICK